MNGLCLPSNESFVACPPGIPCQSTCVIESPTTFTCADPSLTPCDDNLYCNGFDTCDGFGNCISSGDPCEGGSLCMNTCNEIEDNCFSLNGTICSDGIFCNGEETCNGRGVCIGVSQDKYPCASNPICNSTCNELQKTCFAPNGTSCHDGIYCNGQDRCNGLGICARYFIPCSDDCQSICHESSRTCSFNPRGSICQDDGIFCNGIQTCDGNGTCLESRNPCESICPEACDEETQQCLLSKCESNSIESSPNSNQPLIIGVSVGGFILLMLCCLILVFIFVKFRNRNSNQSNEIPMAIKKNSLIGDDLEFGEKIGNGNFGVVYKGKLGGVTVAVRICFFF